MSLVIIAVVEWNSEKPLQPAVFVGEDVAGAKRAAAEFIIGYLPDPVADDVPGESYIEHSEDPKSEINYVDGFWVREHPVPDLADPAAVSEWLDAFKEQTTDCYLNIYGPQTTADSGPQDEQIEDSYIDARSAA